MELTVLLEIDTAFLYLNNVVIKSLVYGTQMIGTYMTIINRLSGKLCGCVESVEF